jgi:predicted NodU family carbamoyl transferase
MVFAHYLNDISLENLGDGNLTYPGKLMGIASYGKARQEWLPYFKQFYKNNAEGQNHHLFLAVLQSQINIHQERHGLPNLEFDVNNRLTGEMAYDVAATSQEAFEQCFFEMADPFVQQYPNLPICITGGCGLNIILNTKAFVRYGREIFVGPNSSDCGIAVGMILDELKPVEPVDITYAGLPLLDMDMLFSYIQSINVPSIVEVASHEVLAKDLMEGTIVGVARGRSEHGPRALGNRSILCNPSIPDMKDTLNAKVKNREWYRPFAPVVRLEDVNKYFEWNGEARWMSFCPNVRDEWKEQLAAITHVDGTARVQTVTREQNEWLYDLLTEFEKVSGVGVLLNTSFNVNGKPILSSVSEAFDVFMNTRLDALVIEDTYIKKGYRE